jgi:PKD repeat protein
VNAEEADRPLTYQWDFGDGSTGTGMTAAHTFQDPGTYTVQFTASNEAGEDSQSLTVTVEEPQPAQVVSLNADPNPADVGEAVSFSSNVQGDSPLSYEWSFGDGTTGSGENPSHTYEEPGTYTVELAASNETGEDSRTLTMTVERDLPSICTSISELNSTFFEQNSSTLTEDGEEVLQENLDILTQCPNLTVDVEGFAAPGERNVEVLSEDRAEAVANFYEEGGVSSGRITTEGRGAPEGVTTKKGETRQYRRADSIPER